MKSPEEILQSREALVRVKAITDERNPDSAVERVAQLILLIGDMLVDAAIAEIDSRGGE